MSCPDLVAALMPIKRLTPERGVWLTVEQLDVRVGVEAALACVMPDFGSVRPRHAKMLRVSSTTMVSDIATHLTNEAPLVGKARLTQNRQVSAARSPVETAARATVVVVPGLMGSHLAANGKRIWLSLRLVAGFDRLAYQEDTSDGVVPDGLI